MTHFAAKRWMLRQVTSYHHKYVKFGGQKHQRKIVVQIPRSSVDLTSFDVETGSVSVVMILPASGIDHRHA